MLAVEVRGELVDREVADLAQKISDITIRAVKQLGDDIHLGAVACGEDDGLTYVVALRKPRNSLAQALGRERQAFQQSQRAGAVIDTDDENGHLLITLGAGASA